MTMRFVSRIIVAAMIIVIAVGLWALQGLTAPVSPASAGEFWAAACGIKSLASFDGSAAGACTKDGYCYFAVFGWEHLLLYRVPEKEAMADLPVVETEMAKRSAAGDNDFHVKAYQRWKEMGSKGVDQLLGYMQDERLRMSLARSDLENPFVPFHNTAAREFADRVDRADYYWACIVFEFIWLSGTVLWIARPILRGRFDWRLPLHWASGIFLFYVPFWFGYASGALDNSPEGGVLYVWLLRILGTPSTNFQWERSLMSSIPPLLSGISPTPYIDWWRWTEPFSRPGLIHAGKLAFVAGVAGLLVWLLNWGRRRRILARRGFEVLPISELTNPQATAKAALPNSESNA
jgi:hypothetical protein